MKTTAEIRMRERARLGNTIRAWRAYKEWSQEGLGNLISMHQSNLSEIEGGLVQASDDTIDKLAKAFDIAPMDLVRCVNPPTKKRESAKVKG